MHTHRKNQLHTGDTHIFTAGDQTSNLNLPEQPFNLLDSKLTAQTPARAAQLLGRKTVPKQRYLLEEGGSTEFFFTEPPGTNKETIANCLTVKVDSNVTSYKYVGAPRLV